MPFYTVVSFIHCPFIHSTGEGITARELAEILALGKQDQDIETQGNALEEAIQLYASNKADKKRYLRIMKTIAARLNKWRRMDMNHQTGFLQIRMMQKAKRKQKSGARPLVRMERASEKRRKRNK
jgi:hypothetical protein